jgi:hypothetical protein
MAANWQYDSTHYAFWNTADNRHSDRLLLRPEVPNQISDLCFSHATCESDGPKVAHLRRWQVVSCSIPKQWHQSSVMPSNEFRLELTISCPSYTVVTRSSSGWSSIRLFVMHTDHQLDHGQRWRSNQEISHHGPLQRFVRCW